MTDRKIDDLIGQTESLMRQVIADSEHAAQGMFLSSDLPLYDVVRYHLGWVDEHFCAAHADPGKRIRPAMCLLSTGAAGGDPRQAVPVAAGVELLHNFTLMHDDVQDRSAVRRGRSTVWQLWGEAQAINAGDATFALSQLATLRASEYGVSPDRLADIVTQFNHMTLQIVEGQVLDLGFEQRSDVSANDYLRMISGKTAAIVAFATWSGARIAGLDSDKCKRYREFGRLLGLGFQIRDDYLGIWGDDSETGKQAGDDIRGRKQSIPIVMLIESMSDRQREQLRRIYDQDSIQDADVAEVTAMLDEFGVSARVQSLTENYHDQALELLVELADESPERQTLMALCERLVDRSR